MKRYPHAYVMNSFKLTPKISKISNLTLLYIFAQFWMKFPEIDGYWSLKLQTKYIANGRPIIGKLVFFWGEQYHRLTKTVNQI